ncbi:high nitrogen upregulated cytochrome P450 monooxygenase 2 [Flagelloscypha sp. PMI_526]|nr:high nitrogen upregulated cytochrome P450 monooxygenase 2 [Flagelloscypha sp. PMI_526]
MMLWSTFACILLSYGFFNRFEPRGLPARLFLLLGLPTANAIRVVGTVQIGSILTSILAHIIGIIILVVLYRFNPWHPLAGYPGPFLARATNFWMVFKSAGGKRHVLIRNLHRKYGTHVRMGPNLVSIADIDAVKKLLLDPQVPRSSAYRATEPDHLAPHLGSCLSVSVPDHIKLHAEKREQWNKGFTSQSLNNYGEFIETRALQVVEQLKERAKRHEEVNIGDWIKYFTWDFIGDIVFGGGFSMIQDGGDVSGFRSILETMFVAQTTLGFLPWLANFLHYLPASLAAGPMYLRKFAEKCIDERAIKPQTNDLFHHFAKEGEPVHLRPTKDSIINDCFLAIGAGGDTTAGVLSALFFYLLSNEEALKNLQREVDSVEGDAFTHNRLQQLPYLNACLDEALRLFPSVLTQVGRTPPLGSGGMMVAGRFVPEGTTVYISPMIYGRDPRYFSPRTEEFWPERWLKRSSDPTIVHNMEASIPFSAGVTGCVGRQLAYREMRALVAHIVQNFDLKFADGYVPPQSIFENVMDYGTVDFGNLVKATLVLRS